MSVDLVLDVVVDGVVDGDGDGDVADLTCRGSSMIRNSRPMSSIAVTSALRSIARAMNWIASWDVEHRRVSLGHVAVAVAVNDNGPVNDHDNDHVNDSCTDSPSTNPPGAFS